jgi:hypothetical protein
MVPIHREGSCRGRSRLLLYALSLTAAVACEQVIVNVVEVAEVEITPATLTLRESDRRTLSVIVREKGGNALSGRAVAWEAEDPEIATVSSLGVVQGRKAGITRIFATSEKISGSAEVRVLPALESPPEDPPPEDPPPEDPPPEDPPPEDPPPEDPPPEDPPPEDPPPEDPPPENPPPDESGCDIRDRTFDDDVTIPSNTDCTFTSVRIRGDLVLESGASLVATTLTVEGNIDALQARLLTLLNASVEGNITFEEGGEAGLHDSLVEGNLHLEANLGPLYVDNSTIGGNVDLVDNSGGPFSVSRNSIDGNLKCSGNSPPPSGGDNTVGGDREGQCRDL